MSGAELALFYVVGRHKDQRAYYSGWWHTNAEPLFTHHPSIGGKAMTRANANRVRRRLENPAIWGGEWALERKPDEKCLLCGGVAEVCGAAHDVDLCPTCGAEDGGTTCGLPGCGLRG